MFWIPTHSHFVHRCPLSCPNLSSTQKTFQIQFLPVTIQYSHLAVFKPVLWKCFSQRAGLLFGNLFRPQAAVGALWAKGQEWPTPALFWHINLCFIMNRKRSVLMVLDCFCLPCWLWWCNCGSAPPGLLVHEGVMQTVVLLQSNLILEFGFDSRGCHLCAKRAACEKHAYLTARRFWVWFLDKWPNMFFLCLRRLSLGAFPRYKKLHPQLNVCEICILPAWSLFLITLGWP